MRLLMIVFVSCTVLVSAVQRGQQKPHRKKSASQANVSTPTVDQILEKYIDALGGKNALEKVNSRSSKGVIIIYNDLFPICAPVSINEVRPNRKVTFVESACVLPIFQWGNNGKDVWFDYILTEGPFTATNPFTATGRITVTARLDLWLILWGEDYSAFYPMVDIKKVYPQLILKGQKKIDGHQSYEVEGKRSIEVEGQRVDIIKRWYFDVQTGLLQCTIPASDDLDYIPKERETCYQDYKQVDNIMVPFTIRVLSGFLNNFVIKLNEVKHDVPIKDSIFNPPKAHKELNLPKLEPLVNPDPSPTPDPNQ